MLDKLLRRIKAGGIEVEYWDGKRHSYGPDKPRLKVTVNDRYLLLKLLRSPSLAVGEAYMDGRLVVDGPIDELFVLGKRNASEYKWFDSLKLLLRNRNTKSRQAKQIEHHYDLGNDFYERWLDKETLGYTCGYYHSWSDSLEESQSQKFDHVLNKLQIGPGMTLLDIGFGWGYLLIRAAKRFGVKGLGVSLSQEQVKYARRWAKREGVDKLVDFRFMNYQDLPELNKQFDRVVSIGFFEHVGKGNHRVYFETVNQMLKDNGVSVLHCITKQKEGPMNPWLVRYIFPGTYVPSVRYVTSLMPDYDFRIIDYENIGQHYVQTLVGWRERFEAEQDWVIMRYGERFYRMWLLYLVGGKNSFQDGLVDLSQWTFTKGLNPGLPPTRAHLYK